MKEQTIAKMVKAGVGQDRAEKFYALFVARMCGGSDPEPGDTFKADEIAAAFKDNIPARNALTGALCGEQKEAPKAKKYKPGRPCTAAEYAEHYARDPENADLVSDITRATDGKPWVVFRDRFRVAESAKFIAWHMDEAIAPATILVDGVPVAPVTPGEERRKEAKEYPVDPHTPGGFLDVENKSPRTGADFTGYTEEEIQATIMAYPKLVRMDDLSLQRLTKENKGKGGAAILEPFAEIAAVWARTKPENRPKTKATKAPRNPSPAGGDVAPVADPVFAASRAASAPVPLVRLDLNTIHRALVDSGLTGSRGALLANIPRAFASSLTLVPSDSAQALVDLGALQGAGTLRDGSRPLVTYLQAAVALAGQRREAQVFHDALRALGES